MAPACSGHLVAQDHKSVLRVMMRLFGLLHSRFRLALWLCVVMAFAPAAWAASGGSQADGLYTIDSWENDDGLPQNSIISMTQTRDGYLWMGTINGLVRFDGLRFTVFNEDNTPGLGSSPIVSLFEDRRGNLWIGSELSGVLLAKDGKITSLGLGRGNSESRLRSICEDAAGAVWLCTQDGQLWRYKDGATNVFSLGSEPSGGYRSVITDTDGQLWIGTDRSISALNLKSDFERGKLLSESIRPTALPGGSLDFLLASRAGGYWRLGDGRIERWNADGSSRTNSHYLWAANTRVMAACEDGEGNLMVGTRGEGVFRFDAAGKATAVSSSQMPYVLSLVMDRENTLWVGTDGSGLNRLKPRVFQVVEPSRGLTVRSVAEDAQGGVWMSFNALDFSSPGAGYWKDGEFRGYGRLEGLINSSVLSVLVDRRGQVWAGTPGALFTLTMIAGKFALVGGMEDWTRSVSAMHEDRTGNIWFGSQAGLVRFNGNATKVFTSTNGLSSDDVRAIADDRAGNLWVGTRSAGLNRLRDSKFTALHQQHGLPSEEISSLYVDAEDALWVGTLGSGLARYKEGRWTCFSTKDGLVSNTIGYVIEDAVGYLWIGSNAGLMRVLKTSMEPVAAGGRTSLNIRFFGRPDGLPTRECTIGSQPGACRGRDGRLWFPTTKGLVSVDPARILLNTNPPPVSIESVIVDGQEQGLAAIRANLSSTLTLSPDREHLEIGFTSLNLTSPERARFKYRLEGHEKDWVEVGSSRSVHYSKLPPGQYRFQVIASNEDGVWNERGSSLSIVVQPPFWRTWWFLGVVFASVLGMVAGIVHYISTQKLQRQLADLRQQEALEKERSRIARDIHDQLGANLTQVSLLGELIEGDKDQPDEVAGHAKQIQATALDTSRALDQIVWTVNPSNDTLDGLVNYLCKYAQEYLAVAGLKYRLEVPPDLPNTPITPEIRHNLFLAAKEAINNVVKHAQADSVWIRLKVEPGRFTIEIQDDGKGPAGMNEKRAQSRNGLRNMGKRLEDVGGKFEIGPAPERGTLVRLVVPLGKS